jgi:hypothetical protein
MMAARDTTAPATDNTGRVTDETILKIAKEIAVKFIEVGRITPANFASTFTSIYAAIDTTVRKK